MRPSTEHTCARCHAKVVLRGAQVFVAQPCPECGTTFRPRDELGGYQLHELLARSGLGIIFRAVGPAGEAVAVKIMQPPLAAGDGEAAQFITIVRRLSELKHPHCLRIDAAGAELGAAWLAMEWLPGASLDLRLRECGRLPEAEVLAIGLQAAAALGAACREGLLHGDLEANNLVFDGAGAVRVTDFMQAALYQIAADDLGSVWGRTSYVSPERLRDQPEEAASDIYSLGAVLFHALTGNPLFGGEPHGQIALELLERKEQRVESLGTTVHEATARVLNRMLASELAERFQTWGEVTAQLHEAATVVAERDSLAPPSPFVELPPPAGTTRSAGWFWFWISLLLVVLIVLATVIAWQHWPRT